jgi:hypothetical protein
LNLPHIIYVNSSRPNDDGDGLSWAMAKKTFQGALDISNSNDRIWVASGVYTPTFYYDIDPGEIQDLNILVCKMAFQYMVALTAQNHQLLI